MGKRIIIYEWITDSKHTKNICDNQFTHTGPKFDHSFSKREKEIHLLKKRVAQRR
jgi:uncharacterized protein YkwD